MPADRRDLRRSLFRRAAEQGGYFSAAQARSIGYSYQAQAHHVGAGNWYRIDRGLFRLAEWVPEAHDDLARWTLWSKGRGVVSHESAAAVQELGDFESPRVHLTVPAGFRMRDDAVVLHRSDLPTDEVLDRTGYRITTPARTLIDLARNRPDEDQLAQAIIDASGRGLVRARRLPELAEAIDPTAALYIERALRLAQT